MRRMGCRRQPEAGQHRTSEGARNTLRGRSRFSSRTGDGVFQIVSNVTVIAGAFAMQQDPPGFGPGSCGGVLWCAQCRGAEGTANAARQGSEPASKENTSAQIVRIRTVEAGQTRLLIPYFADDRITVSIVA